MRKSQLWINSWSVIDITRAFCAYIHININIYIYIYTVHMLQSMTSTQNAVWPPGASGVLSQKALGDDAVGESTGVHSDINYSGIVNVIGITMVSQNVCGEQRARQQIIVQPPCSCFLVLSKIKTKLCGWGVQLEHTCCRCRSECLPSVVTGPPPVDSLTCWPHGRARTPLAAAGSAAHLRMRGTERGPFPPAAGLAELRHTD